MFLKILFNYVNGNGNLNGMSFGVLIFLVSDFDKDKKFEVLGFLLSDFGKN